MWGKLVCFDMKKFEQPKAERKLMSAPLTFDEKVFEKFKGELTPAEQNYWQNQVQPALMDRPRTEVFNYPEKEKTQDQATLLAKQKDAVANAGYLRAKLIEHWLADTTELGNWLGPTAYTTDTAEFDDWLNGIDRVFEFAGDPPRRLAVDFTTMTDRQMFRDKKLTPVRMGIESSQLSEAKYFISQLSGAPEKLTQLPKVTVAIAKENIRDLVIGSKQAIEKSWLKLLVLKEIKDQLNDDLNYINRPERRGYAINTAKVLSAIYRPLMTIVSQLADDLIDQLLADAQKKFPVMSREKFEHLLLEKLKQKDRAFAALSDVLAP